MGWLESPLRVAVELTPAVWVLAAADVRREPAPARLAIAQRFDARAASLADEVRRCRSAARLPAATRVILWPRRGDAGVADLDARPGAGLALPKIKVIRERVAPLVRAGGRVVDVRLPDEAAALVAGRLCKRDELDEPEVCVIVLHEGAACVVLVTRDSGRSGVRPEPRSRYLSWAVEPAGEVDRLLQRYQFGARLAPHVRDVLGAGQAARILACGTLPSLRAEITPLVEELDREIDVLDFALAGQSQAAEGEPDDIAGCQLAWAVASAPGE